MENKLYNERSIRAIANAIRKKLGTDASYTIEEIPNAIMSIPTGGITPNGSITIVTPGTYDVTNFSQVIVKFPDNGGDS